MSALHERDTATNEVSLSLLHPPRYMVVKDLFEEAIAIKPWSVTCNTYGHTQCGTVYKEGRERVVKSECRDDS